MNTSKVKKPKVYKRMLRKFDWVSRLSGRLNARHGEAVVHSHIKRMLAAESAYEFALVQAIDEGIHPLRLEGAKCLTILSSKVLPFPAANGSGNAAQIRAERKDKAGKQQAETRIVEIHEEISRGKTDLQTVLLHNRALTAHKLNCYLAGVKKKLPDFDFDIEGLFGSDTAYEVYLRQHEDIDGRIEAAAKAAVTKMEKEAS